MNNFLGMKIFLDVFWGSSQNWIISRGQIYAFSGSFLKVKGQNGDIFWGC